MIKKATLLITMLLVLFFTLSVEAATKSGTCGENLTWTLSDSGVLEISGTGPMYDYGPSSSPPWYAYDNTTVKSVKINEGITSIGSYAFWSCKGITSLEIPQGVTKLGKCSFYFCSNLKKLVLPSSINYIEKSILMGCENLEELTIPFVGYSRSSNSSSTAVLGYYFGVAGSTGEVKQYYSSSSYVEYDIPDTLKKVNITSAKIIPYGSFYGCSYITNINLNEGITNINEKAFYNCSSIENINIPTTVSTIGDSSFYNCSSIKTLTIPSNITDIGKSAFYKCKKISGSIELPDTITEIKNHTFGECENIEVIKLPNTITKIGDSAFYGCKKIKNINLSENILSIGESAFSGCIALETVQIPSSIKSIEKYTFKNCSSLKEILFPASITTIKSYAFNNCSGLSALSINKNISEIQDYAFLGCNNLATITVDADNLYYTAIENVLFDKNCTKLIRCAPLNTISTYNIPTTVESVSSDAFNNCVNLISVVVPSGITKINGFSGCTGLTAITLPDSITTITSGAFSGCSALAEITIPQNVTSIGNDAFRNCTALKTIYFNAKKCSLGGSSWSSGESPVFENSGVTNIIIGESVETVPSFRNMDKLTTVTINEGVQTLSAYAFDSCSKLTEIVIPKSVKTINHEAFDGCSSLSKITLPFIGQTRDTTTTSYQLFKYIFGTIPSSLTYVRITDDTTINASAFSGCTNINICFDSPLTSVGEKAFYNCSAIEQVSFADTITEIGANAFYGCSSLETLILPDSITTIGSKAFNNCSGLKTVKIPKGLETLEQGMLSGCSNIENLTIPFVGCTKNGNQTYSAVFGSLFGTTTNSTQGVLQYYKESNYNYYRIPQTIKYVEITNASLIPYGAFYNCNNIREIKLNEDVASIYGEAFYDCEFLQKIYVSKNVEVIGNYAFANCNNLTMYGYKDTYCEDYANKNYIEFIALDEEADIEIQPTVDKIGEQFLITVNSNVKIDSYTVLVALYDTDNRMLSLEKATFDSSGLIARAILSDKTNSKYIKIFIWENLQTLTPVYGATSIDI